MNVHNLIPAIHGILPTIYFGTMRALTLDLTPDLIDEIPYCLIRLNRKSAFESYVSIESRLLDGFQYVYMSNLASAQLRPPFRQNRKLTPKVLFHFANFG